jgi:alpha-beta hydrolase superfamily lysophospholipase
MWNEHATLFGSEGTLVGIVTEPAGRLQRPATAAVFINAGVVHRVGPNRMSVRTARMMADSGFIAARFDLSGLGDSPASRDPAPFEQTAVKETREVMDRLQQNYGVDRFILLGLCSGAVVSFKTAIVDRRVVGAVLINPQGFGGSIEWNTYVVNQGQARRFYTKLFSLTSWRRLLTGRSDYRLISQVVSQVLRSHRGVTASISTQADGLAADFRGLVQRGVRLLLACSAGDYALDYLDVILGSNLRRMDSTRLTMQILPAGDHSLTMTATQHMFLKALRQWAADFATPLTASTASVRVLTFGATAASGSEAVR